MSAAEQACCHASCACRSDATSIFDYASQPKERVTSCNLCGQSVFVTVAHRDRYGFPVTVDACRACGLVFLNPRMTREGYSKFYDGPYRELVSAYHGREINAQTIQPEQRRYAHALGDWLAPHLPCDRMGKLLDVGGSTGIVARHLSRRFAYDGAVVDPAASELTLAAGTFPKQGALLVFNDFAEDFQPSPGDCDLITICQTIDHCLDISAVLKMARKAIADDGLLYVDIVDLKAVLKRDGLSRAFKLDHPYYLTEETMTRYLNGWGFRIEAMSYSPDGAHVGFLCRPDVNTYAPAIPHGHRATILDAIREARQ